MYIYSQHLTQCDSVDLDKTEVTRNKFYIMNAVLS